MEGAQEAGGLRERVVEGRGPGEVEGRRTVWEGRLRISGRGSLGLGGMMTIGGEWQC